MSSAHGHRFELGTDPGAGAIRVYRSVGFAGAESQIGFQRAPCTAT